MHIGSKLITIFTIIPNKRMFKKNSKNKNFKTKQHLFEEILNVLNTNPNKALNYKQVATLLKISEHEQRLLINAILLELVSKQLVTEPERGKFKIKLSERYITGKVDLTSTGNAYIISEELEEDVFVAAKATTHAMNGDIVKVYLYPKRKDKKQEGEIVEIIKRAKTNFVGTIQISKRFAFLIPDSNKASVDIYIPLEGLHGAEDGQKAIVKIIDWPKSAPNPIGEVIDILGTAGENQTEMHAILAEFGLPYGFPEDVAKLADLIPTRITPDEIKRRKDFREITTFTIDPVDAKDFDDALSIRKLKNGNWEIGVHIADVTHYVHEGSAIDEEGYSRATSVYLVDRVVPMLPEKLSNNICSLVPFEDRLCFAAVFEMDDEATIIKQWFGRTIIHSIRRYSYEEAQLVIDTGDGDFADELLTLNRLAKRLRAERFKKGSIGFDKLEIKFHLNEVGDPTGVYVKEMRDSNQLIEDFMLLANRKVAEYVGTPVGITKTKTKTASVRPFVYRVHNKPNEEKLQNFATFISKFGYKVNIQTEKTVADSLNKLLREVQGKPESGAIEMLAIRTMAKAIYTTENIGHYGLGFNYYTHFTSPIRRYPDMMVHRLLQHYLDQENNLSKGKEKQKTAEKIDVEALEAKCKHSSDMEKLAADAERASIKYKQVQYLQDKIGEQFEGIISGLTEWGMFVEIIDNHCEGMVRMKDLTDDVYYFDEDNYCIIGRRTNKKYTLGDKVLIQVKRADLVKKQLDFALITKTVLRSKSDIREQELKIVSRIEQPAVAKSTVEKRQQRSKAGNTKKNNSTDKAFNDEWGFEV